MYLGIDIGSSSSKAAILNEQKELVAVSAVNLGTGTNGIETAFTQALIQAGICEDEINNTVATGYGSSQSFYLFHRSFLTHLFHIHENPSAEFPMSFRVFTYKLFQKKDCCYFTFDQVRLAYLHCLSAVVAISLPFSS